MQQIERYGVIALVFFLITIVAVSFWGDSKSPGFWSRLTGKSKQEPTADHVLPPTNSTESALTPPAPLDLDPQRKLVADAGGSSVQSAPQTDAKGAGFVATPIDNKLAPAGTPTVTPAPAPTPSPAATNEYVVQKGDSLALIARHTLGKESRWNEIVALNPGLTPKNLKVGAKLAMPSGAVASVAQPQANTPKKVEPAAPKSKPEHVVAEPKLASAHSCKVQKGDTLKAIARRECGDESRWKEIAELNPTIAPSKLSVGQTLRLPATAAHASESPVLVADAGPAHSTDNKPRIR